MALSSLFRFKILMPVFLGILFTPIPTKLGIWKFLLELHPSLVGIMPCVYPNGQDDWGFNFEGLYGGGNGDGDGMPSNREKRQYRNRLWGQTALVTGANSGTGYYVSLALVRLGANVTMACRNPTKCEAARQKILQDEMVITRGDKDRGLYEDADRAAYVTTMTVDTSSLASVKKFSEAFLEHLGGVPLDMLFLNAGISSYPLNPDGTNHLSMDGIEMTFATNTVGHHLMHKLLEPAILANTEGWEDRKSPARIVQTSSCMSYENLPFNYTLATDLERLNGDAATHSSHYSQSKLAQILWVRELTARLDANNNINNNANEDPNAVVYANAAHPGAVATNIWASGFETHDKAGTYPPMVRFILEGWTNLWKKIMWTSEEGALTLVYLGTAIEDLQQKGFRGKYFHPQSQLVTVHSKVYENEAETNILQAKLWKFLDELVADFV